MENNPLVLEYSWGSRHPTPAGMRNDVFPGKKKQGLAKIVSTFQGSDDAYKTFNDVWIR